MSARTGRRIAAIATLAAIDLAASGAIAGPSGSQVVAGSATVSTQGARTDVVQSSERAVIDWRTFSIDRGEAVHFHQAPSMIALNRVTGDQVSRLHGTLAAAGQVILLNPNGILIGPGARVDAGSFVASTAWLGERDFMAGRLQFTAPARNADGSCPWSRCSGGSVVNEGVVTTNREGGLAAFVAPHVRNDGQVVAHLGTALLGSASSFTLDLAGDGLVRLAISPAQAARLALRAEDAVSPTDVRGTPARAFIEHGGITSAAGGRVVVLAPAAAAAVVDDVIHLGGIVRADTVANGPRGSIELRAGGGVRIDGELGVIATSPADAGGRIDVAARAIAFGDQARVQGGRGGAVGLAYDGASARIDPATARVLGDALASGTDVHVQADGNVRVEARIDGRSTTPGQGGMLAVDAGAIAISNDVLVSGSGLRLAAHRGALEMVKSETPLAPGRSAPILHAGAGAITLAAEGNVVAHHLVTSGDIDVVSGSGNVELRERLGRGEHGPIGNLRVRALGVPAGDGAKSVGSVGNIAYLRDVAVRPGGRVDLAATTNIRLMEGPAVQRGRPSTERTGLLAARRGEEGRSLTMRSGRLTATGDLAADDAYYWVPDRVNSQAFHQGPGTNTVGADGRWIDLARTEKSPETPTLPAPGPINVVPMPASRPTLSALASPPGPVGIPPLPLDATVAGVVDVGGVSTAHSAAPPAIAFVVPAADSLVPILPGGDVHADDEEGPELGGRGVAQEADLGQQRAVVAQRDVFGQRGHVVRARPCDAGVVADNAWFATGAFGQSIPTGCR